MIWRIRERNEFDRLQHDGRRLRSGSLWCTYVLDPRCDPPRVAFAIGRAYGSAVERNRLRRRLRHLLAAADLPSGLYLVGARPDAARRSSHELAYDLTVMLGRVGPAVASSPAGNGGRSPIPGASTDG